REVKRFHCLRYRPLKSPSPALARVRVLFPKLSGLLVAPTDPSCVPRERKGNIHAANARKTPPKRGLSCVWVAKPASPVDKADRDAKLWGCPPSRQRTDGTGTTA